MKILPNSGLENTLPVEELDNNSFSNSLSPKNNYLQINQEIESGNNNID